jgi:hypothetical protein
MTPSFAANMQEHWIFAHMLWIAQFGHFGKSFKVPSTTS